MEWTKDWAVDPNECNITPEPRHITRGNRKRKWNISATERTKHWVQRYALKKGISIKLTDMRVAKRRPI